MEQELLIFSEYLTHFCFIVAGCCLTIIFCVVFCRTLLFVFFVCFLLIIVLSVLRRITASDYPIWYLQTYLSLSLLLEYLYTKASMCLLTRYYCCSCWIITIHALYLFCSYQMWPALQENVWKDTLENITYFTSRNYKLNWNQTAHYDLWMVNR